MSESETKISRTTYGEFSDYDGGGYVFDFDPLSTNNTWSDNIAALQDCNYVDSSSRSLFITFTIMNPSTGIWVSIEYLFEISVLGLVNPTRANVKPFKPNILETGEEKGLMVAEYLRLLLLIYIIGACIVMKIVQLQSLSKIFNAYMIMQLGTDLAIVILVIIIFAFVYVLSDESTQKCLDSEKYIDFVYKAYLYTQIFILESFLFVIIILKMIYVLSIVRTIRIISLSFALAMRQLLAY